MHTQKGTTIIAREGEVSDGEQDERFESFPPCQDMVMNTAISYRDATGGMCRVSPKPCVPTKLEYVSLTSITRTTSSLVAI
jgi:hypothetical protein